MKLTDDGVRCYERAKELLASVDAFESELRGASDEPVGTLRVFAPHAFGQHQLVEPLAAFLAAHPRMTVEWTLHDRRRTSARRTWTARSTWARCAIRR